MAFKPFKFIGTVAKGIFKGVRDVILVPQIEDTLREFKVRKALQEVKKADPNDNQSLRMLIAKVADILDDGRLNDSPEEAKIHAITRVVTGASILAGYIINGLTTGNWIIF